MRTSALRSKVSASVALARPSPNLPGRRLRVRGEIDRRLRRSQVPPGMTWAAITSSVARSWPTIGAGTLNCIRRSTYVGANLPRHVHHHLERASLEGRPRRRPQPRPTRAGAALAIALPKQKSGVATGPWSVVWAPTCRPPRPLARQCGPSLSSDRPTGPSGPFGCHSPIRAWRPVGSPASGSCPERWPWRGRNVGPGAARTVALARLSARFHPGEVV
jgi:hypothetical protein